MNLEDNKKFAQVSKKDLLALLDLKNGKDDVLDETLKKNYGLELFHDEKEKKYYVHPSDNRTWKDIGKRKWSRGQADGHLPTLESFESHCEDGFNENYADCTLSLLGLNMKKLVD